MLYGHTYKQSAITLWAGMFIGNGIGHWLYVQGFLSRPRCLCSSVPRCCCSAHAHAFLSFQLGHRIAVCVALANCLAFLVVPTFARAIYGMLWTLNIGRWFEYIQGGDYAEALYYVKILPWFAACFAIGCLGSVEARTRVLHEAEFQRCW